MAGLPELREARPAHSFVHPLVQDPMSPQKFALFRNRTISEGLRILIFIASIICF